MAGRGVGSGPRAPGIAVYVGATLADIQPMLAADLGILVAPDPEVMDALGLLGVRVDVLVTGACKGVSLLVSVLLGCINQPRSVPIGVGSQILPCH